ncbi:MAG: PQQ-dependent dehydrogenase, methanol/ethanol family, partial [Alphaproteobacteria bacterium]|nr:PQQ-dependent dehydrogenase, methanol/ethanol family [Alphaproteobacteria bacterium]MBU1462309.1 PQQ-dependent dehydrogenase, methanol/ethanol family [Alphaproteobacteria bacterium]
MKGPIMRALSGVAAMAMAMGAAPLVAQSGPTDADLMNDAKSTGDVLTYGMGPQAHRFSALNAINSGNVSKMVPVFSASLGGEKQRGQEAQPIVYDGTIYVTGSYSRLFAFDARTGEEKWQYDARLPDGIMPCCDVVNRGAAIYGDKIIFATLDARLVALNRLTGKVIWNKQIADYKEGYSATAAPLIVNGMVITGNSGGEFGVVGAVDARDVNTGELIWHRPVIEGHMGTLNGKDNGITGKLNASWQGDQWKTGGGATWLGGTYDPETNLLFFGTGNPAPWNSHLRPGDNLYTASTIAIDPATGVIKWHFQTTPHDGWDFDGVNEFIPFDATINGKPMKLGAKADRNGYFFVLDRTNGKFVSASKFVMQTTWADGYDKNGKPKVIPAGRPGAPDGTEKGRSVF